MKDNKITQIINDLYLLFLRIMNLASFFFKKKYFDLFFFKNLRLYSLLFLGIMNLASFKKKIYFDLFF